MESCTSQVRNRVTRDALRVRLRRRLHERAIELFILINGVVAVVVLLGVLALLIKEGFPAFYETPLLEFLFGSKWYPISDPPVYNVFSFFAATLVVTGIATFVSLPIGVGCAIFLAEIASRTVRDIVKPLIEMLSGVPSVVMGVIGLMLLSPVVQQSFALNTGLCAMTAGIMLAFMKVPIVISVAEDALSAVPREFREASYALGANRWQTIRHVCVPAALSGIGAAVMLGVAMAIGETMTVLMVAGGSTSLSFSPFDPMRPMTATIAAEINNAVRGGPQYHALFGIGLVLFVITFFINIIADWIMVRQRRKFSA
jgi:phosphate transport system permease protein